MFINLTNHPFEKWSEEQKNAALAYGEVVDYPFPLVSPYMTSDEVCGLADKIYSDIVGLNPECVMCSGEFTLTYALVNRLRNAGIKTVAACSDRVVRESCGESGTVKKEVLFKFVKFREFK